MATSLRPEFGPTLGELLEPRWRRLGTCARRAANAGGVLLALNAA